MKASLPYWFLSVTALALVGANVAVRYQRPMGTMLDTSVQKTEVERESPNSTQSSKTVPVSAKEGLPGKPVAPNAGPRPHEQPTLNWAAVETTDYKQYAANLRSLGFPEELVRAIVIADLDKLYEPREAPLRPKPVPFDAPVSQRQTMVTQEELLRMRQLRDVQIEKQAAIKEILGTHAPREILTTPTSRNYVAYEYALNLLPPEKRDAAQLALEDEWLADDVNKYLDRASYVEVYKRTREDRNAALAAILTPEEFEKFEMNSTPAGTELARRVIGMEPTDDEFQAMFKIAWDHWVETGGVGGLWRAMHVPPEQIVAADQKLSARLQETLGPDRYLDYQMATSETGQQLRNLAARYDLPRETLVQTFQLQAEVDQLNKSIARSRQSGNPVDLSQLESLIAELQHQTTQVLGAVVSQAWADGKDQRIKPEP